MSDIKHIDPAALAGITTGTLMTDFSALHEAAEHVMGHPIWTHQFPTLLPKIADAVLAQFPEMPISLDGTTWEQARDEVRLRHGATVLVRKGSGEAVHPLDPAAFPGPADREGGR